jgi:tetratricopeptide (TPR) repeat protein
LDGYQKAEVNYLIAFCLTCGGRYREALDCLEVLTTSPLDGRQTARKCYLTAYCLHMSNIDLTRALHNYNLALEEGFPEFWVFFNRGDLYMRLGDIEAARIDLDRAVALDPKHEGAKQLRDDLFLPHGVDDNRRQRFRLKSPFLVCTVPKSGTMLFRNMLLSILGDDLVIPSNCFKIPLVTAEYIVAMPKLTNRIYFGHIWHSENLANRLSSIPKIVVIRDPREQVVSYAHFLDSIADNVVKKTYEGPHPCNVYTSSFQWKDKEWDDKISGMIFGLTSPFVTYPSVYNSYLHYALKWLGPNTFLVRYEDIIGTNLGGNDIAAIKTMKSLMEFIGVEIDEDTLTRRILQGSDSSKSETFRLGGKGKWRQEFKPQHVDQMKMAAPNLLSTLGYEVDENWGLTKGKGRHSVINLLPDSLNKLMLDYSQYLEIRKGSEGKKELERIIDEWAANTFVENAQYQDASLILEKLLDQAPDNPIGNYLYAFCLHQIRKDLTKALHHYNSALQNGYDVFWVKYNFWVNRGSLLVEIGEKQAAVADLERALKLNPDDKETREILTAIQIPTHD